MTNKVGVVVIGRNEGERLRRCLRSLIGQGHHIIYVDSGSADDSVTFAQSLGVDVIQLDMTLPFTMARGRNAGFRHLLANKPDYRYVQFVDGDCEVVQEWIETARRTLDDHPEAVAVAGRRRERYPNASIYNRLCDMEWDTPVGEARSVGGDMMVRVRDLANIGGFREGMIAGEEPELCVRLRKAGWKILRVDAEMTLHDAAMTSFSQWWKRAIRSGHAYAEGAHLHGQPPERHNVRPVRSAIVWALLMPLLALSSVAVGIWLTTWAWLLVGLVGTGYLRLFFRIARQRRLDGDKPKMAKLYALFCILAKWPQLAGILHFHLDRAFGRKSELIEYKSGTRVPRPLPNS